MEVKDKVIVGISGKKYHGKDTIADYLVKNFYFKKMTLAEPVKEITKIAFRLNDSQVYDPLFKDAKLARYPYKTPRELMQFIGTDCFRNAFPDIWLWNFLKRVDEQENRLIVVPDIRFKNEADLCDFTIRVERPGLTYEKDVHSSENDLDDYKFDAYILNETNKLASTYSQIEAVVEKLGDRVCLAG